MKKLDVKEAPENSKLFSDVWSVYKTYYQIESEEEAELLRADVEEKIQPYRGTLLEELATKMFLDVIEDIARRTRKEEREKREIMVFTA